MQRQIVHIDAQTAKTLTPAAAKCAAELQQLADSERARAKMLEERQQARCAIPTWWDWWRPR